MLQNILHFIYVMPLGYAIALVPTTIIIWGVISSFILKRHGRLWKIICTIVLGLSFFAILYATLFDRQESVISQLILTPFITFKFAKEEVELYRTMLMNVILYLPLGLSLPFVFPNRFKAKFSITILLALMLSFATEAIQYIFVLGRAEIDDVIMNTLGATGGALSYLICKFIYRRLRAKKST